MDTTPQKPNPNSMNLDSPNWTADEILGRDKDQTQRFHEPDHIISSIDPISGVDLKDLSGRPYIVDGNTTIYFENEANLQAFKDMPTDHPVNLPDNPTGEGEAEG